MNPLEAGTVFFGLISVWLTVRQNVWCWPTGIIMVALYGILAWQVRLYSDVLLQVTYVGMQFYGWHHWLSGRRGGGGLPVSRLGPMGLAAWGGAALAATALLGTVMARQTHADLPFWNAATTSISLVAQWLMARKVLQCWLLWISVDVLYIGMYITKDLHLLAGLYLVFMGLSASGFISWRKSFLAAVPA